MSFLASEEGADLRERTRALVTLDEVASLVLPPEEHEELLGRLCFECVWENTDQLVVKGAELATCPELSEEERASVQLRLEPHRSLLEYKH